MERANKRSGLPRIAKTQVLESIQRKVRKGVVDHEMVDVPVGDARLSKRLLAGNPEGTRY
jgi:hypothetical protein